MPLCINGAPIDRADIIKCLLESQKPRLPFVQVFYGHADSSTLLQLYTTMIKPHLEYACAVWDPFRTKCVDMLEAIQTFALQVCTGNWRVGYSDLSSSTNIPSSL